MIDIYDRYGTSVIAIMEVPHDEVHRYGVIKGVPLGDAGGRVYEVQDMVEKPPVDSAPSDLAIIGRYILTPRIFEALKATDRGSGGEIQLTDGLKELHSSERVLAYRFRGKRYDAGEKLGFLKATVDFALRNEELGTAFRAYLKSLRLD
jgi:UTP--glucose-1-phosphate uridylyltransferase